MRKRRTISKNPTLNHIESEYEQYIVSKDKVIDLYKNGERDQGENAAQRYAPAFLFAVLDLCEGYKEMHTQRIFEAKQESHGHAARLRLVALAAIIASLVMGILLTVIFVAQILGPVSRLFAVASRDESAVPNEKRRCGPEPKSPRPD